MMKESIRAEHASLLSFLQTIPGVSEQSQVNILIELGGENMSPFKKPIDCLPEAGQRPFKEQLEEVRNAAEIAFPLFTPLR